MLSLYYALYTFFRGVRSALRDPEFEALLALAIIILIMGTSFYHAVEGWSWLDSLYFSVVTLTTVGYGDFTPHTVAGKIFTIVYILLGVGILFGFLNTLAHHAVQDETRGNSHSFLHRARRFIMKSAKKKTDEKK